MLDYVRTVERRKRNVRFVWSFGLRFSHYSRPFYSRCLKSEQNLVRISDIQAVRFVLSFSYTINVRNPNFQLVELINRTSEIRTKWFGFQTLSELFGNGTTLESAKIWIFGFQTFTVLSNSTTNTTTNTAIYTISAYSTGRLSEIWTLWNSILISKAQLSEIGTLWNSIPQLSEIGTTYRYLCTDPKISNCLFIFEIFSGSIFPCAFSASSCSNSLVRKKQ